MIKIGIDPNLVEFGGLVIAWHGVFTSVGILAGVWLAARLMRGSGESDDPVYNGAILAVPIAIVGARILHIAANWNYYAGDVPRMLRITEGGISVWGAVIGGVLGGFIYVMWKNVPLGKFADSAGLGLLLGMAVGRIGDIINGEHLGTPSTLPWSVAYTHPQTLGEIGVPVHLAVGYELLWDVAALGVLLWLLPRLRVRGVAFWLMLALYSIGRLWTHEFRQDPVVAFGMQEAQVIALVVLIVSISAAIFVQRLGMQYEPEPSPEEASPPPGAESARTA